MQENRRTQGGNKEQVPPPGVRFHLSLQTGSPYYLSVFITRLSEKKTQESRKDGFTLITENESIIFWVPRKILRESRCAKFFWVLLRNTSSAGVEWWDHGTALHWLGRAHYKVLSL